MTDPQQVRSAWRDLGRQLAGYRRAAGHTQHSLAPLTCYTRSSVSNIELGTQHVGRAFWERVDTLLGAGGALTAGFDHAEALQRRLRQPSPPVAPAVSGSSAACAEGFLAPLDDIEAVEARRRQLTASNVDEAKLRYLDEAVQRAIAANERHPPAALAGQARQLRSHVHHLLTGRQHPPQQARLYTLAAYLSGLLGALALDLRAFGLARAYGAEAFDLADYLGDRHLQAWARAAQSLIAYYSGDIHDALAYARDGQRRAPDSPHSIRLAVNGEARALARLGDRNGVDEAIDRGFALLDLTSPAPGVSESLTTGPYCPARTAANAATAYLLVGAPQRVPDYAAPALAAFDQAGLAGPQALTRLDLATAALHHEQPRLEQACSLAVDAMTRTADQRYESVNQRGRHFLRTARPWADEPCVRDVAELLAARTRAALPPAGLPSRS